MAALTAELSAQTPTHSAGDYKTLEGGTEAALMCHDGRGSAFHQRGYHARYGSTNSLHKRKDCAATALIEQSACGLPAVCGCSVRRQ